MMKVAAFTLAVVACFVVNASANYQVGAPVDLNPSNPEVTKMLNNALETANSHEGIKKILSVTAQLVNGTKYVIKFLNNNDKVCTATWYERLWENNSLRGVTVTC